MKKSVSVLQDIIDAEPGNQIIYYVGNLAEACEVGGTYADRKYCRAVRADAQEAEERRFCFLVQRRVDKINRKDAVEYIAVRSSK